MIVYADVLIVLNLFVNYFILLITKRFMRVKIKISRIIIGSFLGALSSLYIFLPDINLFTEIFFKVFLCLLITAVVYGIKSLKQFLKFTGVLFLVTCTYAGVMIAIWHLFKPSGMVINNSIVYFNISPISVVLFSAVAYIIFSLLFRIFGRNNIFAKECEITVNLNSNQVQFKAIVDTGNSVADIFGKSEVIIVDESVISDLIKDNNENLSIRYRAIPYTSVSSNGILDGYRCDSGVLKCDDKLISLKAPILAVSKTPIKEDYFGLVNPKILD